MDKSLEVSSFVKADDYSEPTEPFWALGHVLGFSPLGTICYVEHEYPAKHVRSYYTSNVKEFFEE